MDILEKPRLRGVFHQYAFYVAVVAGLALVVVADSLRERLAMWIYAFALAAMPSLNPAVRYDGNRLECCVPGA